MSEEIKFSELVRRTGGMDLSFIKTRRAFMSKMYLLDAMGVIEEDQD